MRRESAEDLWLACVALSDRPTRVRPEHLTDRSRRILSRIQTLRAEGWPVVPAEMFELGTMTEQVARRMDHVDPEAAFDEAERLVLQAWAQHRYAEALRTASFTAREEGRSAADEIVAQAIDEIDTVAAERDFVRIGDAARQHHDDLLRVARGEVTIQRYSGLTPIDRAAAWWRPRRCTAIAGWTSHGKSTLTLQILAGIAERGSGCVLLSLEDETSIPVGRLYKRQAREPVSANRAATLDAPTGEDISSFGVWVEQVQQLPLWVVHCERATVPQLRAYMARAARTLGVKTIAIDYVQAIDLSGSKESDPIGTAVSSLKAEGVRNGLHTIVLSQLRRPSDAKGKDRPTLYMLKRSGDLENSCDCVLIVHRPERGQEDRENAVVYCDKAKDGRVGSIPIVWDGARHIYTFEHVDEQQESLI